MAASLPLSLFFLILLSDSLMKTESLGVGINYGQIANNLPSAARVATLLGSLNITRVKLYDADPIVLSAFANSGVEFVISLGNEYLQKMSDPIQAQAWVQQHVQPYVSQTKITCITVGNEVLMGNDAHFKSYLLPAMQAVNTAVQNLGLAKYMYVTTAHSYNILANSFPPSQGAFRPDVVEYMQGILNFHSQTNSPFLINVYPFFAYKDSAGQVSLEYVLFQPNSGMIDSNTNLHYDNMLYAQVDAVYSAMKALGHTDIEVKVSETGWPSKGDPSEVGATLENARLYNGNLLNRIEQRQGTPAKPNVPVDIFFFALFNENMKPGPVSERNYGLYYPDGTPVYNIGLQGFLPRMDYSDSRKNVVILFSFLAPIFLLMRWL